MVAISGGLGALLCKDRGWSAQSRWPGIGGVSGNCGRLAGRLDPELLSSKWVLEDVGQEANVKVKTGKMAGARVR